MFATHQSAIAAFIAVGTDGWEDRAAPCYVSACFTVQCNTEKVLENIEDFAANGMASRQVNFKTRGDAVRAVHMGLHVPIFRAVDALIKAGDIVGALTTMATLPALGFPKASFTMQMIWGVGGCMDSHNIEDYGIKNLPKNDKKASYAANYARAQVYVDLVNSLGTSEQIWDRWCAVISAERPEIYATADDVSADHVRWIRAMHGALWRMPSSATTAHAA